MATDLDTRDEGAFIYDASDNAWEPVKGKTVVRALTADGTAVNASTTLVSQTGLSTPIAANEVRRVEFDLLVSAAAAADVDIAVGGPSGATADVSVAGGDQADIDVETTVATTAAGTEEHVRVVALVQAGATGGLVTLDFAQNVSNASDAIVHAGSSVVSMPTNI